MTHWLSAARVPLFVSRIRLEQRRQLPRAGAAWALDSGGFTELNRSGRWAVGPQQYASQVRLWAEEIGLLRWAAIQDWMCEPAVLAKTGLSVAEHQRRTTASALDLFAQAPELPWVPVLQGWSNDDYLRHVDHYAASGIDLCRQPLVGLGSVCRRQDTLGVERLIARLTGDGLRLHGFGFKAGGITRNHDLLASADSLAWSYQARRNPGKCPAGLRHRNCNSCVTYALRWRERLLARCMRTSLFHGAC